MSPDGLASQLAALRCRNTATFCVQPYKAMAHACRIIKKHLHRKKFMTDPRNIAHDKKVQQEKKHHGEALSPGADETVQPGKKPHQEHHAEKAPPDEAAPVEGSDTQTPGK